MHSGKFAVMFWGCVSKKGKGPLVVVNGYMDSEKYMELLQNYLIPEYNAARNNFGEDWKFMQDNAPCHKSAKTRDFLAQNGVNCIEWPPYSPDLNLIENIWAYLKQKLYSDFAPATSKRELIDFVLQIWDDLTDKMCARYCEHYDKRLKEVLESKGGHTKY